MHTFVRKLVRWSATLAFGLGAFGAGQLHTAHARNDVLRFPIERAVNVFGRKANLGTMPVHYGSAGPKGAESLGDVSTSKKTNSIARSDEEACLWVFLSALKALQAEAVKRGADALVNVRSNYNNKEFSSATEFECGAGALMAGVALKGTAVRLNAPAASSKAAPAKATPTAPAAPSPAPAAPAPKKAEPADSLGSLAGGKSEGDDLAEARRRFDKGQRLYDLRRYEDSIPEFESAYALSGDPVLLYNLAQAYRMAEKYPDALHYYRAYLKKVPSSPRTELVRKRIAELEAAQEPPNNVDEPGDRR